MRTEVIDLRDEDNAMDGMKDHPHDQSEQQATQHDVLPMSDESATPMTFDTVMRGYSKVQVEDYLDRVEIALSEADTRHAEDAKRFAAYDAEMSALTERLTLAERRAAGQPEAASVLTGRLSEMLALAEREAEEIRRAATEDADRTLADVRHRGELDSAERVKDLEGREKEAAEALSRIDALRLEAQNDAEKLRSRSGTDSEEMLDQARGEAEQLRIKAKAEADALVEDAAQRAQNLRTQADEDIRVAHDTARRESETAVADAQARLTELTGQRDTVRAQLDALTDQLDAIRASFAPRT